MRVVIIPSILAFAYLGPSIYLDSLAELDLLPLVMWMTAVGAIYIQQTVIQQTVWGNKLLLTCLVVSMTVNALVTGLIVFRIFKVFRANKSLGITRGNKLGSITFVIIESGMALFAIQLARFILSTYQTAAAEYAIEFVAAIHEIVNVIISSVIVTLCLLFD